MTKNIPNDQKYTKWPKIYQMAKNIPNGHKIYAMAVYIPNSNKIFHHFPFHGLPKFTKIVSFGMKIHHLATFRRPRNGILLRLKK
jgi:hypothetical protein